MWGCAVKILIIRLFTGAVYILGYVDAPGGLSRRLMALRVWSSCRSRRSNKH
jgi:hypothetical protein